MSISELTDPAVPSATFRVFSRQMIIDQSVRNSLRYYYYSIASDAEADAEAAATVAAAETPTSAPSSWRRFIGPGHRTT